MMMLWISTFPGTVLFQIHLQGNLAPMPKQALIGCQGRNLAEKNYRLDEVWHICNCKQASIGYQGQNFASSRALRFKQNKCRDFKKVKAIFI